MPWTPPVTDAPMSYEQVMHRERRFAADAVHPAEGFWAEYRQTSVVAFPDPPRCGQCSHVLIGHRPGPGVGCTQAGCLCLETGDLPQASRPALALVPRETPEPPTSWWRRWLRQAAA